MKTLAVAKNAWMETVRQPVYLVILVAASGMIVLSHFFGMFTFGQEAKFVRDMGLATMTVAALFQALFSASTVISDEIEKKTVLTVLSKPVSRWQFVSGKFVGVAAAVFPSVVVMGVVLLLTTWWTEALPYVGHAHVEHGHEHELTLAHYLRAHSLPFAKAGFLIYVQVAVMTAVSVAVSTRVSMLLNLVICSVVFVVGNLSGYLRALVGRAEAVPEAVGEFVYAVLPNLGHFNIGSAVGVGTEVPLWYVLEAAGYGLGYIVVALLAALLLFRTREIG